MASYRTIPVKPNRDLLVKYDSGSQIDMIILDFSEAFDRVHHCKLLHKMKLCGIVDNINACLCDFLTNRKMKVRFADEVSNSLTIDSGVPQGTILSSLLFMCHINYIPDCPSIYRRLPPIQ